MFWRLRTRTELGPYGGSRLACLFCVLALACSRTGLALGDGPAAAGALAGGGDPASEAAAPSLCVETQTDPHDCGACGHDCCGGTCVDGVCQRALRRAFDAVRARQVSRQGAETGWQRCCARSAHRTGVTDALALARA